MEKTTEERYRRASVNWGSIAVHPTDLAHKYAELSKTRQGYVKNTAGTHRSRTTALAHIREGIDGLLSNGYYLNEVAAILNIQVSLSEDQGEDQGDNAADAMQERVNAVLDEAIEKLNSLR